MLHALLLTFPRVFNKVFISLSLISLFIFNMKAEDASLCIQRRKFLTSPKKKTVGSLSSSRSLTSMASSERDEQIEYLHRVFGNGAITKDVIAAVLDQNKGSIDAAVDLLLNMTHDVTGRGNVASPSASKPLSVRVFLNFVFGPCCPPNLAFLPPSPFSGICLLFSLICNGMARPHVDSVRFPLTGLFQTHCPRLRILLFSFFSLLSSD